MLIHFSCVKNPGTFDCHKHKSTYSRTFDDVISRIQYTMDVELPLCRWFTPLPYGQLLKLQQIAETLQPLQSPLVVFMIQY